MMLHACFQILKDCVEKEGLLNHADPIYHREHLKEVKKLYDWWEVRKNTIYSDIENEFIEDNKMLIRLIKIRGFLWT